jgi:hypothetical protein
MKGIDNPEYIVPKDASGRVMCIVLRKFTNGGKVGVVIYGWLVEGKRFQENEEGGNGNENNGESQPGYRVRSITITSILPSPSIHT